ncbi:MAG TPA: LysR family transcriptional regulator [Clostridia bacterium]|nr:LysR family transcriptional regulator [Clostridia bacterium]
MYRLKYKLWIDKDGKAFGKGPLVLLLGVRDKGSLSEAARSMNMSYNKAYNLIKTVEEKLGFKLIASKTGGSKGGGSELTEEAERLIGIYQAFYEECEKTLDEIFQRHFGNIQL